MKVGDSIRIFEIIKSSFDFKGNIIGLQRPEINKSGITDGVPYLLTNDILGANLYYSDEMYSRINDLFNDKFQCKHVATMVITKLK